MATTQRYEALMLTVPEITQDETKNLETELDRIVQSAKGSTLSFEKWGKYRLAYPVRNNDYGVYFLMRFEMPQGATALDDMRSLFTVKLHELIMRTMMTRLDVDGSLAYQRPKSLEEMPAAGDVNAFLKEHKMEGLLSSVDRKRPASKPEATQNDDTPNSSVDA